MNYSLNFLLFHFQPKITGHTNKGQLSSCHSVRVVLCGMCPARAKNNVEKVSDWSDFYYFNFFSPFKTFAAVRNDIEI